MSTPTLTIPVELEALKQAVYVIEGLIDSLNQLEGTNVPVQNDADVHLHNTANEAEQVFTEAPKPVETVTEPANTTEAPASTATVPGGVANQSASAPNVELDSDGFPWDARIHASSKARLAKTDQWKKKRGVDAAVVATVEAELKSIHPPKTIATVEQEPQVAPPAPAAVTTPPPPATPQTPPPPTPPATPEGGHTFASLVQALNAKGLMNTPELTAALQTVGVDSIALLGPKTPEEINLVATVLGV